MFDTELYQHVLGLTAPWRVAEVELDVESTQIHVHVEHAEGSLWPCPQCQKELTCYDHAPKRTWRHLNTCQFQTLFPPAFRESSAPSTASCRSRCLGRSLTVASRCSWSDS